MTKPRQVSCYVRRSPARTTPYYMSGGYDIENKIADTQHRHSLRASDAARVRLHLACRVEMQRRRHELNLIGEIRQVSRISMKLGSRPDRPIMANATGGSGPAVDQRLHGSMAQEAARSFCRSLMRPRTCSVRSPISLGSPSSSGKLQISSSTMRLACSGCPSALTISARSSLAVVS